MEPIGATSESNWGSYGPSGSTEDSEIMALLFGNTPFSEVLIREQSLEVPPIYWSEHEMANPYYGSSDGPASFTYWSHGGNTNSCTNQLPSPHDIESYYLNDPATSSGGNGGGLVPMDFFLAAEEKSNASSPKDGTENGLDGSPGDSTINMLDAASPPRRKTTPKRGATTRESDNSHMPEEEKLPTASPKKKLRSTNDSFKLNGKNLNARRAQKNINKNVEMEENNCLTRDTSGNYCSEDDENASPEPEDCVENSGPKGTKTRASRGSATDPQSLYARKRRERINERLRILQNLVPNGTKVDISTMLEEAVQYVKFLQLQIKVLSSDELWMYAPIAYNGMNIGLDLKISPPQ